MMEHFESHTKLFRTGAVKVFEVGNDKSDMPFGKSDMMLFAKKITLMTRNVFKKQKNEERRHFRG